MENRNTKHELYNKSESLEKFRSIKKKKLRINKRKANVGQI